jgi:hypothetical protein
MKRSEMLGMLTPKELRPGRAQRILTTFARVSFLKIL